MNIIDKVIHADAYNIIKYLPDKSIDLCLTDPPYAVNVEYDGYKDNKENLRLLISIIMPHLQRICKLIMLTPGRGNMWLYPEPDTVMAWYIPSGASMWKWGFIAWQPILVYGEDPYRFPDVDKTQLKGFGGRKDALQWIENSPKLNHPCPKPYKFWKTLLLRGSAHKGDIVLDPFAGTGTTGLAAMATGRHYILIEKSAKYIEIVKQRLNQFKIKPDETGEIIDLFENVSK